MNADAQNNATARTQALAVMEEVPVGVTGVVEFRAGGKVLVIGGAEAPAVAATLPPPLVPSVLSLEVCKTADKPPASTGEQPISISGYLGRFLVDPGNGSRLLKTDMVLDLSSPPLLSAALKPPGYVSSPGAGSRAAVEQLSALVGTFDKPQFFDYDRSIPLEARDPRLDVRGDLLDAHTAATGSPPAPAASTPAPRRRSGVTGNVWRSIPTCARGVVSVPVSVQAALSAMPTQVPVIWGSASGPC